VIRAVAALTIALVVLLCGAAGAAAQGTGQEPRPTGEDVLDQERPRCFGAASRDPVRPCVNRDLRLRVIPTPIDALLLPQSPCSKFAEIDLVKPCRFGSLQDPPNEDIALVGDSHAGHWRGAVDVVAEARGARGTGMTRAGCPFTQGDTDLPEPARTRCARWNDQVLAWFRRHPEVSVVFLSSQATVNLERRGVAQRALSFEDRVAGHRAAMRRLPRSVERVIVLRDVPKRPLRTLDCVERAMERRRAAGPACAPPRRNVLMRDPAAVAARRMGGRYRAVDLTPFFCGPRVCPPVIGGALVHKDEGHMTTTYAQTLGPPLLRRVDALVPRPTPAAGAPPAASIL
jgi:hypothetical protein